MSRASIYEAIDRERARQEILKLVGRFTSTCADTTMPLGHKLAVLAEEFGEVSYEVCEALAGHPAAPADLREELVQVAAVCVAWIESMGEP